MRYELNANLPKRLNYFIQIGQLVQGIGFSKSYFALFVHDEDRSLADSGHGRRSAQKPELLRDFTMRIKIRTHGEAHHADVFLLPRDMTNEGVCAYVQNLGIERGELLKLGVERRQLRCSSRRPVQGMKRHYHVPLSAKITELYFQPPFAFNRGQFEIGREVTNLKCHNISMP